MTGCPNFASWLQLIPISQLLRSLADFEYSLGWQGLSQIWAGAPGTSPQKWPVHRERRAERSAELANPQQIAGSSVPRTINLDKLWIAGWRLGWRLGWKVKGGLRKPQISNNQVISCVKATNTLKEWLGWLRNGKWKRRILWQQHMTDLYTVDYISIYKYHISICR